MTEARLPLAELLAKAGDGDFLRSVAEAMVQLLIETDVDGLIGAGRYERRRHRQNPALATGGRRSARPLSRWHLVHRTRSPDPERQVAEAVAGVFNLTLGTTGPAAEQVASALRSSKLLIILDNCEHLTDGAAELAAALLRRSQTNAVLATSRSPLGVPGEQSYALPTLGLPAQTEGLTAAEAMGHTAIQLFVDRAGLASPG